MLLNPWQLILIAIAAWMNRDQGEVIAYLKAENRTWGYRLRSLLTVRDPGVPPKTA